MDSLADIASLFNSTFRISTPLIFAGMFAFLSYLYLRYSKKKITQLESIVKDYLGS